MPSGFQQDDNQLSPGFYRVIITMTGGQATWTQYGSGQLSQQGRVNPFNWDSYSTPPSSDNNGRALAAGNLRWQAIIDELGKVADCQILDLEVTSNSANDANTDVDSVAFTVKYDRNESVFPGYNSIQKSEHGNGGFYGVDNGFNGTVNVDGVAYNQYWTASGYEAVVQTTEEAIRDLVYRGIARGWYHGNNLDYKKSARLYRSSTGEGVQDYITVNLPGTSESYKYWQDITVQELREAKTGQVKSD